MMNPFIQVALGGAAGSVARYSIYRLISAHGPGFPIATFAVNVGGSLVMGILAVIFAQRLGQDYVPLLLTGFLGGFTTFSAFSLDALSLFERGQGAGAAIYVLGSVVASLLAVLAGVTFAREIFP